MTGRIAFIDDEKAMREAADQWFRLSGHDIKCFDCAEQAIENINTFCPEAVITDVKMPGLDGMQLMQRIRDFNPDLPVILITGHGDVPMAVQAMRQGAYDFIEKPYSPEQLLEVVEKALEQNRLLTKLQEQRDVLDDLSQEKELPIEMQIIGQTPAMVRLRDAVVELASTSANIIIFGETGTGKELIARCLHEYGTRASYKFTAVNCAAIPENIFESELFGHEKGAFTDAKLDRVGKILHANKGTLLFDEIESMHLSLQVKLLRVIQENTVEPLGSNKELPFDVRFVAASKADLRDLSKQGQFREDLYFRLNVAEVQIPPLRERLEDVPLLFDYFAHSAARQHQRELRPLTPGDFGKLMSYSWPGNVRELKNIAERYALGIDATGRTIAQIMKNSSFDYQQDDKIDDCPSLADLVALHEKAIIEAALKQYNGNVAKVTETLKVPRRTLNEKMSKHNIDRTRFIK